MKWKFSALVLLFFFTALLLLSAQQTEADLKLNAEMNVQSVVTGDQAKKFYDDNPGLFVEAPETV